MNDGWIGVDLDGTLAEYHGWVSEENIGEPIPLMLMRVKGWLAEGLDVRIFTARVDGGEVALAMGDPNGELFKNVERIRGFIEEWCLKHVGQKLPVTNRKDYGMIALYDDRAIQVEMNTGRIIGAEEENAKLRAEVEMGHADLNARLSATVHALGGIVEWNPTGQHNYLQRIRELRAIELQVEGFRVEVERLTKNDYTEYSCSVCLTGIREREARCEEGGIWYHPLCKVAKSRDAALLQLSEPIPMVLLCPKCHRTHVDRDEWATKQHRTHLCEYCGTLFRPSHRSTVGVEALVDKPKGEVGGQGNCSECGALVEHLYSLRCPACYDKLAAGMEKRKEEA